MKEADADDVTSVEPIEDVGADTADRFRYQAELAARFAVEILCGENVVRIVCEWHEDYLVQYRDGRSELVSVKHRETGQLPWTLKQLFRIGGLAHLFARWRRTGQTCICRLQTNSGMRSGAGECAELQDACAAGDERLAQFEEPVLRELADLLAEDEPPTKEQVRGFLASLKIESGLPDRHHIGDVNLQRVGHRLAKSLGLSPASTQTTYAEIVAEVEAASRANGREVVIEYLGAPASLTKDLELAAQLAAKTVDRSRLTDSLKSPSSAPSLTMVAAPGALAGESALKVKLTAGGLGPTVCSSARVLQLNWRSYAARWSSGLPSEGTVPDIEARVLAAAGRAEVAALQEVGSGPRGTSMHILLSGELEREVEGRGDPTLDREILLGCAYELTDRCSVWWSDPFEVPGS